LNARETGSYSICIQICFNSCFQILKCSFQAGIIVLATENFVNKIVDLSESQNRLILFNLTQSNFLNKVVDI
jgi:hypothetical protein